MIKLKCMLDSKRYFSKPVKQEGIITSRMVNAMVSITIEELSANILKGITFKPAVVGRKETDWQEQQMFALDFDDGFTIDQAREKCERLNILPAFGYTSFSHTNELHKFRLIFVNNDNIVNVDIAKNIQLCLMNIFNECDVKCKNLNRFYYGGNGLIEYDYDNIINGIELIAKYPIDNVVVASVPNKAPKIVNDIVYSSISSNILGCKTLDKQNNYNIKAIRNRDVEYLRSKINNDKIIVNNNEEFYNYIYSFDLSILLEIKYPTSFNCIFHKDNHPSASIFQTDKETYLYVCNSGKCGVKYNILGIIEVLGCFKSRPKAYEFIKQILNIEILESEWQKEQKEILLENLKLLYTNELKENYPNTYANISRNINHLTQMHIIAMDNTYNERLTDEEGNVLFYASTKYIAGKMGMSPNSGKEISKKNVLMQYHKLLNKIDTDNIPEDILARSYAKNINSGNSHGKHINVFSIPSYTTLLLQESEVKGSNWKSNGYTMTGCSREMFYRTEGLDIANELYPQYKKITVEGKTVDRRTSPESDDKTNNILNLIMNMVNENGFVTEKEVVNILKKYYNEKDIKVQFKKSIKEIMDSYNLLKIQSNKPIKEKYNIKSKGYPFIFIKN